LLYAWSAPDRADAPIVTAQGAVPGRRLSSRVLLSALAISGLLVAYFSVREITRSFSKFPFTYDTQCYKSKPLDADGWMTGLYEVRMPPTTRQVTFEVKNLPPDIVQRPQTVTLSIVRGERDLLASRNVTLTSAGPLSLTIGLPDGQRVEGESTRAVIRLDKCFIPRNMGINADGRRLGLMLRAVNTE